VQRVILGRLFKWHQDMVWIVDEKGLHIALCIAKILEFTGDLHSPGDQLVHDECEVIDHK
jgi:hypothetical protein